MTNVMSLQGVYQRTGNILSKEGCKLLISTRDKATPKKPHNFIIHKDNGSTNYVSSLYPKGFCIYELEYQGTRLRMTVECDSATIELVA